MKSVQQAAAVAASVLGSVLGSALGAVLGLAPAPTLAAPAAMAATPKLLVWINGDKGYNGLQKVGDAFAQASGVPVVVQHPEGAPDKFTAAAAAGKGPDVFCWPHDRVGEWAKSGLLVPVTPAKAVREQIEPSAWQAFTWQGQLWGYPLAIETIGLIVNTNLVKTPPANWDEVFVLSKQLQAQGKKAILWDYNKSFFTWPLLAGPGGQVFGRDAQGQLDPSKVGVNNAGALKGALLLERLITEGVMPRGARYSDMEAQFASGQVAMMVSGPWAWDNVKKAGIPYTVAPIPALNGQAAKPFVGVLGCMVSAASRQRDIAREFIEHHLLKVDSLKLISADVPLGTPANKAYFKELKSDPRIRATMDNALAGEAIPNIPEMQRFFPAMDAALEAISQGRQAPKAALDGAAARMLTK